jgi:hypothetical protein
LAGEKTFTATFDTKTVHICPRDAVLVQVTRANGSHFFAMMRVGSFLVKKKTIFLTVKKTLGYSTSPAKIEANIAAARKAYELTRIV